MCSMELRVLCSSCLVVIDGCFNPAEVSVTLSVDFCRHSFCVGLFITDKKEFKCILPAVFIEYL